MDWLLEGVAFAALMATVFIVASQWTRILNRPVPRFRIQGAWDPKVALGIMMAINIGAYAMLTFAGNSGKLIHIPAGSSPQIRQLMFSMMIVMKAVMMVLAVYLIWAMVSVMLGHVRGVSPRSLTLFVLLVPVPLLLYTVKLRRYRR